MKNIRAHILFWSLWFTISYAEDYFLYKINLVADLTYILTQNIFLFYSFLFCLKRYSIKNKKTIFVSILYFVIICSVFIVLRYSVRYYFLYYLLHEKSFRIIDKETLLITSAIWITNYLLFASGYYYFEKSIEKERILRVAEEQKLEQKLLLQESEKRKMEFEQAFIRAQINPHFLYNVLSYIYSETLQYSEKLAESVYILSDIMRYSLQPEMSLYSKVKLEKEYNYIQNFIKLNQFRFNNKLQIDFNIIGDIEEVEIAPMILMTFVENIFKHGEITDDKNPVFIYIEIKNNQLYFISRNKKKSLSYNEFSNGVGLDNIKRRLSFVYKDNYNLIINEEEMFYSVDLTLFNL